MYKFFKVHKLLTSNMELAVRLMPKAFSRISPCMFSILLSFIVLVYIGASILQGQVNLVMQSEQEALSKHERLPFAVRETNGSCDLFTGKWVWDNVTHPLYKEEDCPYIDTQLSCHANGRPDNSYLFWRWQPDGCDLPRFNATMIMESIRGKKMLFVGDSLSRGHFYSMVCLVHGVIPESERSLENDSFGFTFRAKNYNATIQFLFVPFILEFNSFEYPKHKNFDRILRNNSLEAHGAYWKGADVMIFNTYAWWLWGTENIQVLNGSFEDKPQQLIKLSFEDSYRLAINSMLKWVKKHMKTNETRVFFTSMSPIHTRSAEWGGVEGGNCFNETTMIEDKTYWGSECKKSIMQVIEDEFAKSEYPITLLNITQLSNYRKDAHLSIYKKHWTPLTPEELANPVSYADCMHFCLPGLQDTWNELLFSKLLYP